VPKKARKRDKGRPASLTEERRAEATGPEGLRGLEEDDEGLRLVSTRGTKTNARLKAGACKKGQQVDGVSGLSG